MLNNDLILGDIKYTDISSRIIYPIEKNLINYGGYHLYVL